MWNDPIVEETRKVRDELAAKLNYDVQALGKYYKSRQEVEHRIVVTRTPKQVTEGTEDVSLASEPA